MPKVVRATTKGIVADRRGQEIVSRHEDSPVSGGSAFSRLAFGSLEEFDVDP
jgi:hypothetical protein